jgi:hypothetical protein
VGGYRKISEATVLGISSERRRRDSVGRDRVGDIAGTGTAQKECRGGRGSTGSWLLSFEKARKGGWEGCWGKEHCEDFF